MRDSEPFRIAPDCDPFYLEDGGGWHDAPEDVENAEAPAGLFQILEIVVGRTVDVRRRQAIRQQTDLTAEMAARSVPSAHDRATIQTATTRRAGREDTR
jgi:hypothetical protein